MIEKREVVKEDTDQTFFKRRSSNQKPRKTIISRNPKSLDSKREHQSENQIKFLRQEQKKKEQRQFFSMVMSKLRERQNKEERRTLKDIRRQNQIIESHFQKTMLNKSAIKMIEPPDYMRPFQYKKQHDNLPCQIMAIKSGEYNLDNEDIQLNQVIRDIRRNSRNVTKRLSKIGLLNFSRFKESTLALHKTMDSLGICEPTQALEQQSLDKFLLGNITSREEALERPNTQAMITGFKKPKFSQLNIPIQIRPRQMNRTSQTTKRHKQENVNLNNQVSVLQSQRSNCNTQTIRYPLDYVEIKEIWEKCTDHQNTSRLDPPITNLNFIEQEDDEGEIRISKGEMAKIKEQTFISSVLVKKLNGSVGGRKLLSSLWKPSKFRLTKKGPQINTNEPSFD